MSPLDWFGSIDRLKLLGEPNAMRWLKTNTNDPDGRLATLTMRALHDL